MTIKGKLDPLLITERRQGQEDYTTWEQFGRPLKMLHFLWQLSHSGHLQVRCCSPECLNERGVHSMQDEVQRKSYHKQNQKMSYSCFF